MHPGACDVQVGRSIAPFAGVTGAAIPPLCSCLIAYTNSTLARALWRGAAERLVAHKHRNLRQSDQEMIWLEWSRVGGPNGLRVLSLPEEVLDCPAGPSAECSQTRCTHTPHCIRALFSLLPVHCVWCRSTARGSHCFVLLAPRK